jgi:DNA mismatch repair protein MutL
MISSSSSAPPPTLASAPGRAGAPSFAALRVVGQVGGTYLVLDGPDGMVVIDQHAAHERVVFERLRAARRSSTRAPSQPLLLPLTLDLRPLERAALDDASVCAELAAHGLEVEGFGHQALVRALPPGLDGRKALAIVRDALAELGAGGGASALDDRVDAVCARLACHAAVRAGDALAPAQVRALLEDLDRIDLGAHCPHGRPVVRTVAFAELARWFDR